MTEGMDLFYLCVSIVSTPRWFRGEQTVNSVNIKKTRENRLFFISANANFLKVK